MAAGAWCLAADEQAGLRSLPSRATELGNCREGSSGILCEPDLTTGTCWLSWISASCSTRPWALLVCTGLTLSLHLSLLLAQSFPSSFQPLPVF